MTWLHCNSSVLKRDAISHTTTLTYHYGVIAIASMLVQTTSSILASLNPASLTRLRSQDLNPLLSRDRLIQSSRKTRTGISRSLSALLSHPKHCNFRPLEANDHSSHKACSYSCEQIGNLRIACKAASTAILAPRKPRP